jgi:hypothetical protein
MKNRRAVSEIVSALLIIAVVASGLGLYVTLSQQRILGETQSVKDAMESSENRLLEIVEQVTVLKNYTGAREVSFFVHNYGLKNVTVTQVFVNGTKNIDELAGGFAVRTLDRTDLGKTIPFGSTSEILLNFTKYSGSIAHIDSIVIVTGSNKVIELKNGTG